MKKTTFIAILATAMTFSSCYKEIDLDGYRNENGKNLLTLNSLVCPDSVVQVSATKTHFFSDIHNEKTYVKDLEIAVSVNGEEKETMRYDARRNLYTSGIKPRYGDKVAIRTVYSGKTVEAIDSVPGLVKIEDLTVERQGPVSIYSNWDFVFTYGITFTDRSGEDNYYFLQWNEVDRRKDVSMGERDFTHEKVFQQLANQIHSTLPDWEAYSPYGLPFSDKGIDGKTHTLEVREIVQLGGGSTDWKKEQMKRKFSLYAISKTYYDYLVSILLTDSDDGGIGDGLIDLGIADPIKVYSNVTGGIGILGCYTTTEREIDAIQLLGPLPKPN